MRLDVGMHMRLEQIMEQRLVMAQLLQLDTEGGKNAREQYEALKKITCDLEKKVYSDTSNFHDRVMKRIRKKDRTDSVKELIAPIRAIIEHTNPSLDEVRKIIDLGMVSYERAGQAASTDLNSALTIVRGASLKNHEMMRLVGIGLAIYQLTGNNPLYSLFSDLIKDPRTSSRDIFLHTLTRLEGLAREGSPAIPFISQNLRDSLPQEVSETKLDLSLDGLLQHYEINGNLTDINPSEGIRDFLGRQDADQIAHNLPIPIAIYLGQVFEDQRVIKKLSEFFHDAHFARSKDTQRAIQRGLAVLYKRKDGKKVITHMADILENSSQLAKTLSLINLLSYGKEFYYDLGATSFGELQDRLRNRMSEMAFSVLDLSEEHKKKLLERAHEISPQLIKIISTLSSIYEISYREAMPTLRRVAEVIIDDRFTDWRYSHERAAEQLAVLSGKIEKWKENKSSARIIGDTSGVLPRLEAVKLLGQEAKQLYQKIYGKPAIKETVDDLEKRILETEKRLKDILTPQDQRKPLGIQARDLRREYTLLRSIELFENITLVDWQTNKRLLESRIRELRDQDLKNLYQQAVSILSGKELERLVRVSISETDYPTDLFEVGRIPVQSCQRWTERTGYNYCLPAYVADPNKKVIQIRDSAFSLLGRSILRLLPIDKKTPLLLIERPYSTNWSADYAKAVVITIFEKAMEIANETGAPVAVGSNDQSYIKAIDELAKGNVKVHPLKKRIKLPRSMNYAEYSDALGGRLNSGSEVDGSKIRYVLVGKEK